MILRGRFQRAAQVLVPRPLLEGPPRGVSQLRGGSCGRWDDQVKRCETPTELGRNQQICGKMVIQWDICVTMEI